MENSLTVIEKKLDSLQNKQARKKYVHSKAEINFGYYQLQESQLSNDNYEFNRETFTELPSAGNLQRTNKKLKTMTTVEAIPISINRDWLQNYIEKNNVEGQITDLDLGEGKDQRDKDKININPSKENTLKHPNNFNLPSFGNICEKEVENKPEQKPTFGHKGIEGVSKSSFNKIVKNFTKKMNLEERGKRDNEEVLRIPCQTLFTFLKLNYENLKNVVGDNTNAEDKNKIENQIYENFQIFYEGVKEGNIPNTPNFKELKLSNSDMKRISPFTDIVSFTQKTLNHDIKKLNLGEEKGKQEKGRNLEKFKMDSCFNNIIQASTNPDNLLYSDKNIDVIEEEDLTKDDVSLKKDAFMPKKNDNDPFSLMSIENEAAAFLYEYKNPEPPKNKNFIKKEKNLERVKNLLRKNQNPFFNSPQDKEEKYLNFNKKKNPQKDDSRNVFKIDFSVNSPNGKEKFEEKTEIEFPKEKISKHVNLNSFGAIQSPELEKIKNDPHQEKLRGSLFLKYQQNNQQNSFKLIESLTKEKLLGIKQPQNIITPDFDNSQEEKFFVSMKRSKTQEIVFKAKKKNKEEKENLPKRATSNNNIKKSKGPKNFLKDKKLSNTMIKVSLVNSKIKNNEKLVFSKIKPNNTKTTKKDILVDVGISKNIKLFFTRLGFPGKGKAISILKSFPVNEMAFINFFIFLGLIRKISKSKISALKKLHKRLIKETNNPLTAFELYLTLTCLFLECKSEKNLRTFFKEKVNNFSLKNQLPEIFKSYVSKEEGILLKDFLKGKYLNQFGEFLALEKFNLSSQDFKDENVENSAIVNKKEKRKGVMVNIKFDERNREEIFVKSIKEIPRILEYYVEKYNLDEAKRSSLGELLKREVGELEMAI